MPWPFCLAIAVANAMKSGWLGSICPLPKLLLWVLWPALPADFSDVDFLALPVDVFAWFE